MLSKEVISEIDKKVAGLREELILSIPESIFKTIKTKGLVLPGNKKITVSKDRLLINGEDLLVKGDPGKSSSVSRQGDKLVFKGGDKSQVDIGINVRPFEVNWQMSEDEIPVFIHDHDDLDDFRKSNSSGFIRDVDFSSDNVCVLVEGESKKWVKAKYTLTLKPRFKYWFFQGSFDLPFKVDGEFIAPYSLKTSDYYYGKSHLKEGALSLFPSKDKASFLIAGKGQKQGGKISFCVEYIA